ncbi:hypothetical protein BCR44DRAFT_127842 [Catenaria anguillulae PL171]|uniref:Uncharacterized protein n=1 Tax=Catenaria anguillulae PL171 TaxID=765915 RepID=A0A1Y2HJS1_9FUNG|nr:hypothetical protein BCR44DRAFT_127842 [Catenaria anguillulae PL171]
MTDRVLNKLKLALESGDYYSAHQMYLTVCNRYVKGKKIDAAVDLLTNGAKLLCEHKQFGSALDMASVVLKTWTDEEVAVDDKTLGRLFELMDLFAGDSREFNELMKNGIKWTSKCGEFSTGEPALHHHVGVTFANVGKVDEAHRHFMLGTTDSAASVAVLLLNNGRDNNLTTDQMASTAMVPVLQYLSSLRIAHALTLFNTFVRHLEQIDPEIKSKSIPTPATTTNHFTVYTSPVLNFVHLVLLAAQRGPAAAGGYQALCGQYLAQPNASAQELLERVGETVFGMKSRRAQQGNMLQDLMSSLLGGMQ